nr:hypothetical protein [Candidatus Sigynarchaeum springense]MDO8118309.1 hypothetical protein [Candidatus Sigynarchaeota archaeon]
MADPGDKKHELTCDACHKTEIQHKKRYLYTTKSEALHAKFGECLLSLCEECYQRYAPKVRPPAGTMCRGCGNKLSTKDVRVEFIKVKDKTYRVDLCATCRDAYLNDPTSFKIKIGKELEWQERNNLKAQIQSKSRLSRELSAEADIAFCFYASIPLLFLATLYLIGTTIPITLAKNILLACLIGGLVLLSIFGGIKIHKMAGGTAIQLQGIVGTMIVLSSIFAMFMLFDLIITSQNGTELARLQNNISMWGWWYQNTTPCANLGLDACSQAQSEAAANMLLNSMGIGVLAGFLYAIIAVIVIFIGFGLKMNFKTIFSQNRSDTPPGYKAVAIACSIAGIISLISFVWTLYTTNIGAFLLLTVCTVIAVCEWLKPSKK